MSDLALELGEYLRARGLATTAPDAYARLSPVEAERFSSLFAAARAVAAGDGAAGARALETLIRSLPDEEDGRGAVVARAIAEALLGRVRHVSSTGGNLYLGARPPGAQLRAFELLRLRTPLIPFAYAAANRALLTAIADEAEVTIVDVGIGRGGQLRALLRHPAMAARVRRVRVIGVEPDSADVGGALQVAEQSILETARDVGIEATFAAIARRGEDLGVDDLVSAAPMGRVVATCSFSLHHVLGDDDDGRVGVLRTLCTAGVDDVVLAEPDSNHADDDLPTRTIFAYRHYGALMRCLTASLSASDAALVWTEFFTPEIRNVIGHDGPARTERHEEATTWVQHLVAAGFDPVPLPSLVPQAAAPPGFDVRGGAPAFSLAFGGVPILSVLQGRRRR